MELLEFGHSGAAVLVFPTREGRFYDYENWGIVSVLQDHLERGHIRLFCVDSIDGESLYCGCSSPQTRIARYTRYQRYILDEVVPLARAKDAAAPLVAHGCSIGAYHAVALALRHPELFQRVVAFSGRYDLTRPIGPFRDLFDGYYNEDLYFLTPSHFIPNLTDPVVLDRIRQLDITFAVGEADWFRENTEHLSDALRGKGVVNQLYIWTGEAHRARSWRQMAGTYF
jgi:esterase/lipase superfamily enzyme